jgi:hypothetical protein
MMLVSRALRCQYALVHSIITRVVHTSSAVPVSLQMKNLIDEKRSNEALSLFDANTRQRAPNNMEITQALKACAQIRNVERGTAIHRALSMDSSNDPFIQTSLINFYSEHIGMQPFPSSVCCSSAVW